MSIETSQITINGLPVQIVRKAIKNLHLGVYPPEGRVRVAAPLAVTNDAVRLAVIGKLPWIRRQRAKFETQPRQSEREMVRGESHYFLGQRYRLRCIYNAKLNQVLIRNRYDIEIRMRKGTDCHGRERVLHRWYRQELKRLAEPIFEKWQSQLQVHTTGWNIKKMKTKWGSCNVESRRIWLNVELAKKPLKCLEYLVLHELIHLLERHHNSNFVCILEKHMPAWRTYRDLLNSRPLAHEVWPNTNRKTLQ